MKFWRYLSPTQLFFVGLLVTPSGWTKPASTTFQLVEGRVTVMTPSWGKDCGDRPNNRRDKSGQLYRVNAAELRAVSGTPKIAESGVCRAATNLPSIRESRTETGFRCQSPDGSATQVSGRVKTQFKDNGTALVTHNFEYNWRLHGSVCQVKSQGRWRLRPQESSAIQAKTCTERGPATQLRFAGKNPKKITPGTTQRFRASLRDSAGCAVNQAVQWSSSRGRISADGRLTLAGTETAGWVTITAKSGKLRRKLRVKVAQMPLDDDLILAAPSFSSDAASRETITPSRYGLKIEALIGQSPASGSSDWDVIFAGGAILLGTLSGGVAIWLRRRQRRD